MADRASVSYTHLDVYKRQQVPLLDCFTAPCKDGCPIGQDIPEYIQLCGQGKYREALALITEKNPLPFITGTICAHRCMDKCTRHFYEDPVQIRAAKLQAAQGGYDALLAGPVSYTHLCYEVSDRDGEAKCDAAIQENADFIAHCEKEQDPMVKAMFGGHALFTISDRTFEKMVKANDGRTGFHIHVAEGMNDVYDSLQKYGTRSVNRLLNQGILGPKTLLGHCIHVNPAEMDIIKETGTMVAVSYTHLPRAGRPPSPGPGATKKARRGIYPSLLHTRRLSGSVLGVCF